MFKAISRLSTWLKSKLPCLQPNFQEDMLCYLKDTSTNILLDTLFKTSEIIGDTTHEDTSL